MNSNPRVTIRSVLHFISRATQRRAFEGFWRLFSDSCLSLLQASANLTRKRMVRNLSLLFLFSVRTRSNSLLLDRRVWKACRVVPKNFPLSRCRKDSKDTLLTFSSNTDLFRRYPTRLRAAWAASLLSENIFSSNCLLRNNLLSLELKSWVRLRSFTE